MPKISIPELIDLLIDVHPVTLDGEGQRVVANERLWGQYLLSALRSGELKFRRFSGAIWRTDGVILGNLVSEKFSSGYVSIGEFLIWLRPILSDGDFMRIAKSLAPDFEERNCPPHLESAEERQARRYNLCIKAGLSMPTDTYAHLPRGIGKLAHAEKISTSAFSKDIKAYIERKS